jgi:hypothetical protein
MSVRVELDMTKVGLHAGVSFARDRCARHVTGVQPLSHGK